MPGERSADPLLRAFLFAPEPEFRAGLDRLLAEKAGPVARSILHSRYGAGTGDPKDLYEDVMLRLIERLHRLRQSPGEAPIADFRGYVAAVTYHVLAGQRQDARRERRRFEQDRDGDLLAQLPDPRADVAADLELRTRLRSLWREIRRLPARQCAALLLNLRDAGGRSAIVLLPLTGTASIRQIAAALEMPARRFAQLWNRLPLEDAAIAELLGATRQQVINLRKAARERLTRRARRSS